MGQWALRPAWKQLKNRYKLVGAEIGVHCGVNALYYLEELDIKQIFLIDPYIAYEYAGKTITSKEAREWEEMVHVSLDKYKHKIKWIKEKAADAAKFIADNSLDFVYIDGNHDYEFVVEDILLYYPKVKEGGLLSGHDYHWESVKRAVDEFVKTNSLDLCIGETKEIRRKKTYDWWIWKKREEQ